MQVIVTDGSLTLARDVPPRAHALPPALLAHLGGKLPEGRLAVGNSPWSARLGVYLFLGLLAFTVDLTDPLEPTFVLPFSASTAAIRVSALSVSAARRALWVALRWLARRFISFALFVRIGPP